MKIELVVDGITRAVCSNEADLISFQAAMFSAVSEQRVLLDTERRMQAEERADRLFNKVFKTAPTDHNSRGQ